MILKIKKVWLLIGEFGFIFALKHSYYKIFKKNEKYINLIYNHTKNEIEHIIEKYNSLKVKTSIDSISEPIPVWVCWWQGAENMPILCQICYKQLHKMMPKNSKINLITKDNYFNYVDIPENIIKKLNNGKISITYFSDILRQALLLKWGGMWIDSTVYCTNKISPEFMNDGEFWSVKLPIQSVNSNYLGQEISKCMWSGFILKTNKQNIVNQFVLEAMYYYADKHDVLIDYFLQNLFLRIGYDNISQIKQTIDRIPYNNIDIYKLYEYLDNDFDMNIYTLLSSNTDFFKLTWKREYNSVNDHKLTFYGYIKEDNML